MVKNIIYILFFSSFLLSQSILVKSIIINTNGFPISDVIISCNKEFTMTDLNGYFTIECGEKESIIVSHIKYKNRIIRVDEINTNIYLEEKHFEIEPIKIFGGLNTEKQSQNISVIPNYLFTSNGKEHFEDVINLISNVNYSGGTSRPRYFQIRGLGELSQFAGEGPPHFYIGYIIDNIDFSGIGSIGLLTDIKQIEIFKGPQTSAYGSNAMGGIINLISNDPSNYKYFNTKVSFTSKNGYNLNSTISFPITNSFFSRLTFINSYDDGMIINKYNNRTDSNSKQEQLLRAKFIYKPNKSINIKFTSYFILLNNKYDAWSPDNNGFITYSDYQGYDNQRTQAFSLNSSFDLEQIEINSVTSYSKNNILYSYDGDWANNEYWAEEPYNYDEDHPEFINWGYWSFSDSTNRTRTTKSQELRINKQINNNINLLSGIFISSINEFDQRNGWLFAGYADQINSTFKINNYAIYSQIDHDLNNNISLLYSLRYDYNHTEQILNYSKYNWYTYQTDHYYFTDQITDKDLIGGNIQLSYTVNDKIDITTSVSRGYKTAGINQTQSEYLSENFRIYNTEFCNNYEFGMNYKNMSQEIMMSLFYLYRKDPQLRLFYQFDENPVNFDYATFNTSYGYNYGIEIDYNLKINNFLMINNTLGLLNTYVSKFTFLNIEYGNRELAHSPKFTYNIRISYDFTKYVKGLSLSIESTFKDSFYFDDQNNHKSKKYNIVNFSTKYKYKDIEICLWSNNIFNTKYSVRGYTFALEPIFPAINNNFRLYGDLQRSGITVTFNL